MGARFYQGPCHAKCYQFGVLVTDLSDELITVVKFNETGTTARIPSPNTESPFRGY